jgi:hemerythrin-like domain-containing protein
MMNVLAQLKSDHENVATLLDILDHQIDLVKKLEKADYDLMRDIMHYMTTYPDGFHHPMEDFVIEKLIERDPSCRDFALAIVKEHSSLAKKSNACLEMLLKVIDGEVVLRQDIVSRATDYIQALRSHMQREEERLFPRDSRTKSNIRKIRSSEKSSRRNIDRYTSSSAFRVITDPKRRGKRNAARHYKAP